MLGFLLPLNYEVYYNRAKTWVLLLESPSVIYLGLVHLLDMVFGLESMLLESFRQKLRPPPTPKIPTSKYSWCYLNVTKYNRTLNICLFN